MNLANYSDTIVNRLYGSFSSIMKQADENKSFARTKAISTSPYDEFGYKNYKMVLGETGGLLDLYNIEILNLKKLPNEIYQNLSDLKALNVVSGYVDHAIESLFRALAELITNCHAVLSALEPLTRSISSEESQEASTLEKEILPIELIEKPLYDHLKEAIDLFRLKSNIGSALVASKVATYVLENIELDERGKKTIDDIKKQGGLSQNQLKNAIDEERTRMLVEKDFVRKEERDKFISGLKKIRNAYTHDLGFVPRDSTETNSFLTDAVRLAKIRVALKNSNSPSESSSN